MSLLDISDLLWLMVIRKRIKLALHFGDSFREVGSRVSSDKARFMQVMYVKCGLSREATDHSIELIYSVTLLSSRT